MKWFKERPKTQKCTTCKELLLLETFPNSNRNKWGKDYRCGRCSNRKKTALNLFKSYGLTVDQYLARLEQQSYSCYTCKRHQINFQRPLSVDHSHSSGQNRKLLCSPCNVGIGMARENPEILDSWKRYLAE